MQGLEGTGIVGVEQIALRDVGLGEAILKQQLLHLCAVAAPERVTETDIAQRDLFDPDDPCPF